MGRVEDIMKRNLIEAFDEEIYKEVVKRLTMIQAKDLRVGLWFNRKHGKGWSWIILDEDIIRSIFSDSLEYALNDFEPIPLTSEILLMAGFTKSKQHSLDYFYDVGNGKAFCFRLNMPFKHNNSWYPEKKYLHELQNLLYTITGCELNIKYESNTISTDES